MRRHSTVPRAASSAVKTVEYLTVELDGRQVAVALRFLTQRSHDLRHGSGLHIVSGLLSLEGELLDDPRSVVFQQAENRLHSQKAVMLYLAGKLASRS